MRIASERRAANQYELTIDAAVFVADAVSGDVHHSESARFLQETRRRNITVLCPLLCPIEVGAAVMRRTGNQVSAQGAIQVVRTLPQSRLAPLNERRAVAAEQAAIQLRLRGADSIYVATPQEFGTTLVTCDTEVITRAAPFVTVTTPTDWLQQNPLATP